MAQLNRLPEIEEFYSSPSEDYVVIDSEADSVLIEINEWNAKTCEHFAVKLRLHHSEARLLAEMLTRNANEAGKG